MSIYMTILSTAGTFFFFTIFIIWEAMRGIILHKREIKRVTIRKYSFSILLPFISNQPKRFDAEYCELI